LQWVCSPSRLIPPKSVGTYGGILTKIRVCRSLGGLAYDSKNDHHHTGQARPSMEACGIDMYATVQANGYPIEVVKDYSDDADYYGLVLIE